jgi:uncharacterized protein YbaA (DUF1428 family)
MKYVDGFVIPVPKKKLGIYRRMARESARIWHEYGALEYRECVGDDLNHKGVVASFLRIARARKGETVVFSWIVYRSKSHRDKVNAKIMKDPRIAKMMATKDVPFDPKKMAYGGFRVLVDAQQ